ncbi:erythroblast NAD(P)(+)--arginine ADP-ribosyltransferase-like, partial [Notechis scutatus]|uniref:NAD(P)(+)--arginine ADP-ribosyltransferase n=1 Tax=Notechis scutatus TaxID=8663 RepID=A0A6J1WC45_9SAUR
MKTPSVRGFLVLCLIGCLAAPLQVLCLEKIPLDMAKDSLDDPYNGCVTSRELKLQKPGYVPLPKKYLKTWQTAISHVAKLGNHALGHFNRMYATALMAYTIGDHFYADFNAAVRQAGRSKYAYVHFPFKDYFLLLNRALQAKKTGPACYEVFRGIHGIRFTFSGKVVRFGQFASSSLIKKVSEGFGEDTFFSIRTCHGVPISPFSLRPYQLEVLIPPYETFTVVAHQKTPKGVYIRLVSRGVYNRFNCESLKGKKRGEERRSEG